MARTSRYAKRLIRLAEGQPTSLGKVKNITISWGQLGRELESPVRTGEKFRHYQKLSNDERNRLKNVNGWYLGGHCEGGRRRRDAIKERDILTFDLDDSSWQQLEDLRDGITGISGYEFYAHTTRSHTAESPRLRIYVLLEKPIAAEKYDAACRIFSQMLDPTLDSVDDVSFRVAQLMYKPTCSKDGEFDFIHNPGIPLAAGSMLDAWGDWRDYTKLPFSEKQGQKRPSAKKAEDPRTKDGIIGAFCRAYDVETAIAEFIPDIYSPGDQHSTKPRYTYNLGSGANGVVVEDDGLFIYSHHGTDPCGDRLCNAWDMVRLHKFEDLDADAPENTSPSKMPSFKAMVALAEKNPAVREEMVAAKYDLVAIFDDVADDEADTEQNDLEDLIAPAGAPKKPERPKKGWPARELETDMQGNILPTLHNVATIVRNDPRLWGVVGRNEFTAKIVARRTLQSKLEIVPSIIVEDRVNGLPWQDLHDYSIRALLEAPAGEGKRGYSLRVTDRDLNASVVLAAQHHKFHPVKEYFEAQRWDGEERVERIFIDYLGCPDEPYYRETIRLFLIAAVARIYRPGHKFDFAPILSGAQGIRKSTFIKALFSEEWTGELSADFSDHKTLVEQMLGKLCQELPELSSMRKSESEHTKAFMTIQVDEVRLAYERRVAPFPRQCVFMGTTNASEYLKDQTGNRRWWPIPVLKPVIDTDRIVAERDQIWAEAVHLYREMCRHHDSRSLPLFLTDESAIERAITLQDEHREENPEEGTAALIAEWANTPRPLSVFLGETEKANFVDEDEPLVVPTVICVQQVYIEALGGDARQYAGNPMLAQRIGAAMRRLEGWRKSGGRPYMRHYGQQRVMVREDSTPEERERGYRIVRGPAEADNSDLL